MGSKVGGGQEPKSHSMARQGSIYSLTLDEVQNHIGDLGKPLSSMNLDELLKAAGMGFIDDGNASAQPAVPPIASASSLHRQGSLTLSRDLSKKTVDEVWRDIQQGQGRSLEREVEERERNPTLGELTLEDFLVKAGVVAESTSSPGNKNGGPNITLQPAQWMQYQQPQQQQQQQQQPSNMMDVFMLPVQQALPVVSSPIMEAAYPDTQMAMVVSPLIGNLSSDTMTPQRKRGAPVDVVEKTVERRQKRMIKNRESAARSRARKQAYTHELENKISRLEEENERLKKLKEVEKVIPCAPPPEPKYQLRRTSSGPL